MKLSLVRTAGLFLGALLTPLLTGSCGDAANPEVPSRPNCIESALALQNPRAHTIGETYHLPQLSGDSACPAGAQWEIAQAPTGSQNVVYPGLPQPRVTPDIPGSYVLRVRGVHGREHVLTAVSRSTAERFRNHYLTPLQGLALIGRDLWAANGASYTVTRLVAEGVSGAFRKQEEIVVGSWPAAIAGNPDQPYVVVAQRGSDSVGFVDKKRGVLTDALWVGDEPSGLAMMPDGKRLFVSLPTSRSVAVVDLEKREVTSRISVGFDPRAMALSPDGRSLFVASYRSGNLQDAPMGMRKPEDDQDIWVIDTSSLQITKTIYSVAADLRALSVSSDGTELYVAATDGDTVPTQSDPMAKPFVHQAIAISASSSAPDFGQVRRRVDLFRQSSAMMKPFVNPGGVLSSGSMLWLSAEGSDEVVALDRATLAEKFRVKVGSGPRQLVALDGGSVAVHCFQSFDVVIIGADGTVLQQLKLSDDPRPAPLALGEKVFNRSGAGFAANHACASCHVETQNDGMVWNFGPRIWHNVRPLQLLAATTPIEWGAYVSSADNFGFQGPASIVGRPATTAEAEGLAAFLSSLIGAPRANTDTRPDGSYTDAALRGKELFEKKLSCAGCHTPPLYTSRTLVPKGKSGEPADVPSLLGVYRHGVYMVNGKSRRLEDATDVALKYVGAQLSDSERVDLIAFLRQLTPKGSAPLGIWPDIDSSVGVYPDVQPWVAFSDPVDDSQPGRTQSEVAQAKLVLEETGGGKVSGSAMASGGRISFVPSQRLSAGKSYRFCVLAGLPFQSGGVLENDRCTSFQVAQPPVALLPSALTLNVQLPPMGPGSPPPPIPLALDVMGSVPGGLSTVLTLGTDQKQKLWARVDGDKFYLQPFALPIPGRGTADAASVVGKVTMTTDPGSGRQVAKIEGTFRLGAPGINVPGLPFSVTPR